MARIRARREGDCDYFVEMVDAKDNRRVAVGIFYGASGGEAIVNAERRYPGLFTGMETKSWSAQASLVTARRVVAEDR